VSPTETAELIEMSFGLRTQVGPRNHVLDGSQHLMGRGNFEGEREAHCKLWGRCTVSCTKKRLNPIELPLGFGLGWAKEVCIRRGPDLLSEGAIIRGKDMPTFAQACLTTL